MILTVINDTKVSLYNVLNNMQLHCIFSTTDGCM